MDSDAETLIPELHSKMKCVSQPRNTNIKPKIK